MHWILNAIGAALTKPLSFLSPVAAIFVLAIVTGAASLLVFRWTSDQGAIRRAKGPMKAHVLGIYLFRHDLGLVLRSLFAALGKSLTNLRFLAIPMAVMILPLLVIFVQLDLRYGFRGIEPGKTAILRVELKEGADANAVKVTAPDFLLVDSPGVRVRDPQKKLFEVDYRLKGWSAGEGNLVVHTKRGNLEKRITVSDGPVFVSPVRESGVFASALFAPAEPAIPRSSDVKAIDLSYGSATYRFLGIDWAWWTLFLVFMVIALYALKRPLRVDF